MSDSSAFFHPPVAWWRRSVVSGRRLIVVLATMVGVLAPTRVVAAASELVNISVRTRVGTGEAVLIAGFVVSGEGTRPLLVRAVGPTLGAAPYNVPGVLADPGVRVHQGNITLQTNDDWGNDATLAAAFARLGAFPLDPTGKDAALLAPLTEGIYTAVAHGTNGQTGEMLLEVYDAREGTGPVPVINNLSLRAELPAGGTMIAGFVVAGGAPKRLLIRAIGPTLGTFGVTGVLEDPRLRLFTGATDVAVNDDWNLADNAEAMADTMRALGAFSLARNARDAAALTTLQPGSYTLHVTSADPTAGGVTLVEIYDAELALATPVPPVAADPGLPTVTATVTDGDASEAGDSGRILISRTGATTADLIVHVNWSGTAMAGLDYIAPPATLTIPAGSASTTVDLIPLPDTIVEAPEAAILALVPHATYNVGAQREAGILIADLPAGTTAGWRGEYFNNNRFSGSPALVRTDAAIQFEWPDSPAPGINADNFSVRWTGVIVPPATQDYNFVVFVDDRVRLWVDDQLVIDRWSYDWRETAATLRLTGGVPHLVRMEMNETWGAGAAYLDWSTSGQGRHALTEVITPVPTPAAATGLDRTVALVGEPFVAYIDATGAPTTYSAAGLPPGLALNTTSGVISGTPTTAGEFPLWIGASNGNGGGSLEVTLQVLAPVGTATRETFAGMTAGLTIPFGSSPTSTQSLGTLAYTTPAGPLTERVRGYLTAPADGLYRFWLSASGAAEFHFADSEEPGDKTRRARVTGGTGVREWNREAGQISPLLQLTAGSRYYFEIVHAQPSGTGHVELGWIQPGQTGLLPFGIVPGYVLSPFDRHIAAADGSSLFLAALRPPMASTSLASGSASVALNEAGTSALVTLQVSGLSSAITGAHLIYHAPAPGVASIVETLPNSDVENTTWTLTPVGDLDVAGLGAALHHGRIIVRVQTTEHPAGEIEGVLLPSLVATEFRPPAEPPALALAAPTPTEAARFLMQTTFGPTSVEIARVQSLGYEAWLAEQFSAEYSPMLPYIQQIRYERRLVDPDAGVWTDVMTESWWRNVINGSDQLRQRVAFALSQILVVSENSALGGELDGLATYYDLLGRHAFGNYRELLEDVSLSPAMGVYLSMIRNRKPNPAEGIYPDENFAREVMQLFSIGLHRLHPDGSPIWNSQGRPIPTYQQPDIVGLAHVFTGWTFASNDPEYYYLWGAPNYYEPMEHWPEHHDRGAKRLLDAEVIPADRTGPVEMDHVLDMLFQHPNTGPFICRQLIQRLVTSNPSPGYVYRVAQIFADNGQGVRGDLRAVVRAILLDWEARSADAAAQPGFGKLREPLLRIAHLWRAFEAEAGGGRFNFAWTQGWLAQEVLQSPTVFNFFQPGYVAAGPAGDAGLVAPEFQVATDGPLAELFNTFDWLTYRPAEWTDDPVLDLAPIIALLGNPDALGDRLNLLVCAGGMSEGTRTRLTTMLAALPAWTTARDRAVMAVHLVVTSPDGSIQK